MVGSQVASRKQAASDCLQNGHEINPQRKGDPGKGVGRYLGLLLGKAPQNRSQPGPEISRWMREE